MSLYSFVVDHINTIISIYNENYVLLYRGLTENIPVKLVINALFVQEIASEDFAIIVKY